MPIARPIFSAVIFDMFDLPRLSVLVRIILAIEFGCLLIYAGGGRVVSGFLREQSNYAFCNSSDVWLPTAS